MLVNCVLTNNSDHYRALPKTTTPAMSKLEIGYDGIEPDMMSA
jgi:hypothetical protein